MATIKNTRDINLQATSDRILDSEIDVSANGSSFVNTSGVLAPSNIIITASIPSMGATHTTTWEYKRSTDSAFTAITGTTNGTVSGVSGDTLTISSTQYTNTIGAATVSHIVYKATAVQYAMATVYGEAEIQYVVVGLSGFSGSAGSSGFSGFSGNSGVSGVSGRSGVSGVTGVSGFSGTEGSKSITISAFQWYPSSTPPSHTQAFTYTWSSGAVSAYPGGWLSYANTGHTSGDTLHMISITLTALASATTTSANWSIATTNTVGYTIDGSIGPQGDGHRIAYCKSTIASPSGTTTSIGTSSLPATGSFGLTSAGFYAAPPALTSAGEYLYQTDGIYVIATNTITWQTPYLSNLKVGSLQALSANLGSVEVAALGSLYSTGKAYGTSTAGFFLGYSSSTAKFDCTSSASNYLRWNGTSFEVLGGAITGSSFQTAASGNRITINESSNNQLNYYGSSGSLMWTLGGTSGVLIGTSNSASYPTMSITSTGIFPAGRFTNSSYTALDVVGKSLLTGQTDVASGFRVTGTATSASGAGVEIVYSGGAGLIAAYDRTGSVYKDMYYSATAHYFNAKVDINGAAAPATAGHLNLGSTTQTTVGANGAASALTANPLGYIIAYIGGTKIAIPYYNG